MGTARPVLRPEVPPKGDTLYSPSRVLYSSWTGKGNSKSNGARPVHLIITMIQWIRTSRLSIKNSLSGLAVPNAAGTQQTTAPLPGSYRKGDICIERGLYFYQHGRHVCSQLGVA